MDLAGIRLRLFQEDGSKTDAWGTLIIQLNHHISINWLKAVDLVAGCLRGGRVQSPASRLTLEEVVSDNCP